MKSPSSGCSTSSSVNGTWSNSTSPEGSVFFTYLHPYLCGSAGGNGGLGGGWGCIGFLRRQGRPPLTGPRLVSPVQPPLASPHQLHRHWRRDDARPVPLVQQPPHRLLAARAVVQGPVVDVHADEAVRQA